MNKYLLLRNNKQTGPHSLEEIREMGLKRYDLIWVDGKSAAWRYAGEIEEMKSFAPLVEEQPFDRFYKRPAKDDQKGIREEKKQTKTELPEDKTQQRVEKIRLQEKELKEMRSMLEEEVKSIRETIKELPAHLEALAQKQELKSADQKQSSDPTPQHQALPAAKRPERPESQPNQERKAKKYVSISMPAGKSGRLTQPPAKLEKKPQPALLSAVPISYAQVSVPASAAFTSTPTGRVSDDHIQNNIKHNLHTEPQEWVRKNYQQILQYAGLGLALASLLVVGVLIGMSVNSDPVRPPVYQSQQKPVANPQRDQANSQNENTGIMSIPASNNLSQESLTEEPIQVKDDENISPVVSNKKNTAKQQQNPPAGSVTDNNPEDGARDNRPDVSDKIITASPAPTETAKPTSLSSEVSVKLNDYKINVFGGIDDIEVTVSNKSAFVLDLVVVEIDYIQSNKKVYKTETVRLKNIAPGASANAPAPKTTRGIKINSRITYITSAKAGISENL